MTTSGLDGILPMLACPHCGAALEWPIAFERRPLPERPAELEHRLGRIVGCPAGHRFDVARQGYLSLLGKGSRTDTGDSADMVAARVAFLGAGHYLPVADAIAAQVAAGPVLEVGAGTGYYLAMVVDRLSRNGFPDAAPGIALDSSRYAARRAVSAHPAIGSIVADAWSALPVRDGAVGTVLSVFAPRDPAEITRVLGAAGRCVVVTPEPDHLDEIRSQLGLLGVDPGKPERLAEAFEGRLHAIVRVPVRKRMGLTREDVSALVRMGPAARHLQPERLRAAIAELADRTIVTMAVTVSVFEK